MQGDDHRDDHRDADGEARAHASRGPPRLDVRGVTRRFGRRLALDAVSLALPPGEVVAVLGPSGCGKSTLLRVVAGLDAVNAGEIRIDGHVVADAQRAQPPETRGVGMMFQEHALFPHLTVLANVCFGLARLPRMEARVIALRRLEDVGLAGRADSYPDALSGGEAQRVALARALAPQPRLLLLDEPFSSLDPRNRLRVRADTLALLRAAGTTAILVTHDRDEAVECADRIALMSAGRVIQVGTAEELYRRPLSPIAARALGDVVELTGRSADGRVDTALGPVAAPGLPDGPVHVCLRPHALRIGSPGAGVAARVLRRAFAGAGTRLHLGLDALDAPIVLTAPPDIAAEAGGTIGLRFDPAAALVFPDAGEGRRHAERKM